jgi:hypothetical protein
MSRKVSLALAVFALLAFAGNSQPKAAPQPAPGNTWSFAVSGDSRNCGDVVMPGIAASALQQHPSFYWHLGDFRAMYTFDEDILHEPEHRSQPMTILSYLNSAWEDFIKNQIESFGALPVFLGIGNHELVDPKTRQDYIQQFGIWLAAPVLQQQRMLDNPNDHRLMTYFHWVEKGVDFISMDNGTLDQFSPQQVAWFERVLKHDNSDSAITTIVVGMHRALPESISRDHSMNESPDGTESGRQVYRDLLEARDKFHKKVYNLASHSHFYMGNTFNTEYWKSHGGVLPGWIVGTAGAVRYALPLNSQDAQDPKPDVYGYLLGTVGANGEIDFQFHQVNESDTPAAVVNRFTPEFVHWCFAENSQVPKDSPTAK